MFGSLFKLSIGVLIGSAMIWLGLGDSLTPQVQRAWPTATATILESSIIQLSHDDDGPQIKLQVRFNTNSKPQRALFYTYDFDREGDGFVKRLLTEKIPKRYETGQTLPIFYNPAEPSQIRATTEPASTLSWPLIVFGVLIAGACLLIAAFESFVAYHQWKMNYHLAKANQELAEGKALLLRRDRQLLEPDGACRAENATRT